KYYFKEFQYSYLFLCHKKTKCWINGESMSRNIKSTLSISKVNQSRVESTFEKI
ncbi:16428_t:CDS:1, partial [Funneliformis geosporum]